MNTDFTHSIDVPRIGKRSGKSWLPAALALGTWMVAASPVARLHATSLGAPFDPYYSIHEIPGTEFPGFGCPFFVPQITGALLLFTDPVYGITIARDADGHIHAITSGVEQNFNDGMIPPGAYSVAVAPNGALLVLGYLTENDFGLAELKAGQSAPAISSPITAPELAGVNYGFLGVSPDSMGGGGRLKFLRGGTWYDLELTEADPAGPLAGLYVPGPLITSLALDANPTGGQLAFVPAGTPGFARNAVLFPDDSNGKHTIAAFDLDEHANPLPATRRDFLVETSPDASPLRGIVIDPVTGDFIVISGESQHMMTVRRRPVVAPTIAITAPLPGAVLPQGDIAISASVIAGAGAVKSVTFYEQGIAEGFAQSTAAPYSGVAKNLLPGAHTVFARATDVNGQTAESPHITFTIARSPSLQISRFKVGGVRLVLSDAVEGKQYALETREAASLHLGIGVEDRWVRSGAKTASAGEVVWEFPEISGVERVYRAVEVQP